MCVYVREMNSVNRVEAISFRRELANSDIILNAKYKLIISTVDCRRGSWHNHCNLLRVRLVLRTRGG